MSVYIGAATKPDYSAMRGPCPEGFHVPSDDEWRAICSILTSTFSLNGNRDTVQTYLKLPFAGYRGWREGTVVSSEGSYWSYNPSGTSGYSYNLSFGPNYLSVGMERRACGLPIRAFKDTSTSPDNNWTTLYDGSSIAAGAGIFYNTTLGLISISGNGTTWYTIQDKNLGATTVYNSGDTYSGANCGGFFQRGNNYMFPFTGSTTTSSTQVDASTYGPGNYYNSSTFIFGSYDWSSVSNNNLRGGTTGVVQVPKELEAAYIGEYDCIEYKMNADSNGNLYVPVSGYSHSYGINCAYNWNVSVDGGASTNYSGTGSSGGSITLSGYTAGTNHTIKITPTTEGYGWALAYGWDETAGRTYLTEVIYDGSYMGYGVSATSTGNNFRRSQYDGCTSLTTAPAEVLPNTVTSIGTFFRHSQYYGCTSLISAPAEVLPNSVTTIGDRFRYSQYHGCTLLTTAPAEVLPDTVTSIGAYFRNNQYNGCTSLTTISGWKDLSIGGSNYRRQQFYNCTSSKTVTVLSDVGYASYDSDTLQNSYVTAVNVPSTYLSNFTGASVQPRSSITDSKFIGY